MKKIFLGFLLFFVVAIAFAQEFRSYIQRTTPTSDFVVHNDGTVTHKKSGLMWKVASEGQKWKDGKVSLSCLKLEWDEALKRAEAVNKGARGENLGYTDWRVPTVHELYSLVEIATHFPAINLEIFPKTPPTWYLSASESVGFKDVSQDAWFVNFQNGDIYSFGKDCTGCLRLVRSQP